MMTEANIPILVPLGDGFALFNPHSMNWMKAQGDRLVVDKNAEAVEEIRFICEPAQFLALKHVATQNYVHSVNDEIAAVRPVEFREYFAMVSCSINVHKRR